MEFVPTQIATEQNQFGYSDFEAVVFNSPEFVLELVLTIPFDENESPYLRFIIGDQDQRFNYDTPCTPITLDQAHALLNGG